MGFANSIGGSVNGLANASAATVYYSVIPGRTGAYARVASLGYTCGNTANSFYLMRPIGRTTVAVAALSNAATLTLTADPSPSGNTIAAGDQVVYVATDGTYNRGQVNTSGWNGTTKVLTLTANVVVGAAIGAKFFMFGIFSDTDPVLGTAFPVIPTVANTTNTVVFQAAGFCGAQAGDPLMIYNPNATNATNLNFAEYVFTRE